MFSLKEQREKRKKEKSCSLTLLFLLSPGWSSIADAVSVEVIWLVLAIGGGGSFFVWFDVLYSFKLFFAHFVFDYRICKFELIKGG